MSAADDFTFGRDDVGAERLAAGFAEHMVRWARSMKAAGKDVGTESDLPILRRCARAASLATSNGHVCIPLSELAEQGEDFASLSTALLSTGVVGRSSHPGALPLIIDEEGRLYLHRYFDYEARLAGRLMQAAATPPRAVDSAARDLLDTLFPPAPGNEVDWQKIAAAMALRNTLTVISGGPGTGKTTTVVNLLACLLTQEPQARVALAAPTGKAAARLVEAIRQRADHLPHDLRARLPHEAFTIHRLLGANPGQGRYTHDAGNPLPIDVLIVDEASMLDLAMATRLLEAVPASARIILLGDKDQLSAVESGAVFAELCADPTMGDACRGDVAALCGYAPERIAAPEPVQSSPLRDAALWLTKNYRFGAGSGIGRLATCINEGRAQEAMAWLPSEPAPPGTKAQAGAGGSQAIGTGSQGRKAKARVDEASLSLFPELDRPAVGAGSSRPCDPGPPDSSVLWLDSRPGHAGPRDAILAGYAPYLEAVLRDSHDVGAVTRAFARFRVLCAVRQGPSGVTAMNDQLARHARQALGDAAEGQGTGSRSPWYLGRPVMVLRNDDVLKLFNGDIGIALPDASGELAVYFPDGENGYRAVPTARLPEHETAYAMTVHKAQGSEFDAVLLALPPQHSRAVARELLYTAVTRAKQRVTLSAPSEVLVRAVATRSKRHSGLLRRMRDAARLDDSAR
jgi:exodeoxyribonuclease V alpha subunit